MDGRLLRPDVPVEERCKVSSVFSLTRIISGGAEGVLQHIPSLLSNLLAPLTRQSRRPSQNRIMEENQPSIFREVYVYRSQRRYPFSVRARGKKREEKRRRTALDA
jgi:hypothetical protein